MATIELATLRYIIRSAYQQHIDKDGHETAKLIAWREADIFVSDLGHDLSQKRLKARVSELVEELTRQSAPTAQ